MSRRYVQEGDFRFKTVRRINCEAVNVLRFYFDDGTTLILEVVGDAIMLSDEGKS